jgi:uncharacterized coiled-coil protein SlyX
MDPVTGGSLILPGALVVTGLGALVACITFLFHALMKAKDSQIDDLKTRLNLQDAKIETISNRLTDGLEKVVTGSASALGELNANMMARFQDLEDALRGRAAREERMGRQ